MAGDAPSMGALAWRAPRPVEVGACGRAAFPGRTKRWPSPQPFPPAGEGARRHAARSSGADQPKAERSDGPSGLHLPSGRAEKRRAWGGHGLRSKPMLRTLTRCGCLSEARKREASSAAPPRARASQVARSEAKGHGQWGRLSFAYFSLARQRKVGRPPGRTPGQPRSQAPHRHHQATSFNNRRNTFPDPVAGNASMKATTRGAL